MSGVDWDDLRFVLKVAEAGSIAGAAESLQVNRTTVLRRINQFEQQLDAQLFDRHGSGYSLAPGAEELLSAAMEVEKTIDDLHRQILGKTLVLQGNLCVTTTDSLFSMVLAPHLAAFHRKQPGIRLELLVSNRRLSLSRRDADVAIRSAVEPPEGLTAHRLRSLEFGIYCSKRYQTTHNARHWSEHNWLGLDSPILEAPPGKWLTLNVPSERICLTVDSFLALRDLAELGLGLALLPIPLVESDGNLVRVFKDQPNLETSIWLVTHPDLARAARVDAFINHMLESFA